MWKKLRKSKKGFSLVELLGVVVLLGILSLIAVPAILNYIQDTRDKTFMINVQSVVNKIKETKAVTDIRYCVLSDLLDDTSSLKAKNVKTLDIIVYQDASQKTKYAVNAISEDEKAIIMTADFDKLTLNKKNEWDKGGDELSQIVTNYLAEGISGNETLKKEIKQCDAILEEIK